MIKKATTLEEQVTLLRGRGVVITSEEKAKECLLDIGYFRLCSYLFPFEKSYPNLSNRTHEVVSGTRLSDAVALYYFDLICGIFLTGISAGLKLLCVHILHTHYQINIRTLLRGSLIRLL